MSYARYTSLGKLYTFNLPLVGKQQVDIPVEQLVDDAVARASRAIQQLPVDQVVDRAAARAKEQLRAELPKIAAGAGILVLVCSYLGARLAR